MDLVIVELQRWIFSDLGTAVKALCWCVVLAVLRETKKPLSLTALRGVARDGSLPAGLVSHALGKYDDDAGGNECDHAFSFPSE
ncbi:hypothetical protein [Arthrobacter sp. CG_A4]|uniref:hypothetical protein n=1 Tax=Arthrobacter sp. CG_A4 TaxID=3071706 RepID=UPI002E041C7F|nr:hypothetical protein [Arthrobacter sp. CG_A4]